MAFSKLYGPLQNLYCAASPFFTFQNNCEVKVFGEQKTQEEQHLKNNGNLDNQIQTVSSTQLTNIKTDLLANGLNFPITSKALPNKDIATIKDAVKDLKKEEAGMIHAKISITLQNSKLSKDNRSKDECKALNELQSDSTIEI